jgi:peroxiredoxin
MSKHLKFLLVFLISLPLWSQQSHPVLALGSPAPNFALPGIDGKVHKLADYAASPVLVLVFTCNHCPIAQMYEQRIKELISDYGKKGVAVVAIQGNDPKALQIGELDSSDISDTLPEMKIRAQYKHITYPYLYAGDSPAVVAAYGPQATPHVFIFDKQRKLRYQGRMDNSYRIEKVNSKDARNAIDNLLAGKEVAVKQTPVFGCSTKWPEKISGREAEETKLEAQTVTLDMATAADLKKLRANATNQYVLVDFWATWCGSCVAEFADLQDNLRMYGDRDFSLVTVSTNTPDEKAGVMRFLNKKHATSRNLLFSSDDTASLQAAFNPKWQSAVPYTVLIAPGGKILYEKLGSADMLELRRILLANMPSDYIGFNKYWQGN